MKWFWQVSSENPDISGLGTYAQYDNMPIEISAEFQVVKTISMAINMASELAIEQGYRTQPIDQWAVTPGVDSLSRFVLLAAAAEPRVKFAQSYSLVATPVPNRN